MNMSQQYYPSKNCEIEIHKTHFMQPSGIFIAVNLTNLKIKYASSNWNLLFKEHWENILETTLDNYFTKKTIDNLYKFSEQMTLQNCDTRCVLNLELLENTNSQKNKSALVYFTENILCLEFQIEEANLNSEPDSFLIDKMIQIITHSKLTKEDLAYQVCEFIREITQFERVYYCEFQPDGHGFVVAESTSNLKKSILHHHFPATDVPLIVRKLYTRTRYRLITDAHYDKIPIEGLDENIDLSQSLFRAIGGTHLQYLKNMGTAASASFSVVEENTLRGLIGCHNSQQKSISLELLPKINLIVETFATRLLNIEFSKIKMPKENLNLQLIEFIKSFEAAHCNIEDISKESLNILKQKFDAQAILYGSMNHILCDTECSEEFKNSFQRVLGDQFKNQEIVVCDKLESISTEFAKCSQFASGLIYISLDDQNHTFISILRKEQLQTYKWSGDPNINKTETDGPLNPRTSFSTWYDEIRGMCHPWNEEEMTLAKQIRLKLIEIRSNYLTKLNNINKNLNEKNKEISSLLSEVHHRVKNNLAIVNSFFDLKIRRTTSTEVISELNKMKNRIRAISSLHEALYQTGNYGSVNLEKYFKNILNETKLLIKNNTKIEFKLIVPQSYSLPIQQALPLGLITHEFITNSIKYAFAEKEQGKILVEFKEQEDELIFTLKDNGTGYESLEDEEHNSLGLKLMKLLIKQLDAKATWDGTQGVSLTLFFNRK